MKTALTTEGFVEEQIQELKGVITTHTDFILGKITQLSDTRSVGQHRIAALRRQSNAVEELNNLIEFIAERRIVDRQHISLTADMLFDKITVGLHEIKDVLINNK